MSPPSSSAPLGSVAVQVLKGSGKLFESGIKILLRLSVSSSTQHTSARRHPLLERRKPIVWNESFSFPLQQPSDALTVSCHRDDSGHEQLGSTVIPLTHLPQGTNVVKWYELKLKDKSSAVVQLGLCYGLSYSLHHTRAASSASLTMHPSSQAREHIRQQLVEYAHKSAACYRFVDYFAVVGCHEPHLASAAHTNQPAILARFPDDDYDDVHLPEEVALFAFSEGYTLSSEQQQPRLFSFRLNVDLDQLMVACLMYWEEQHVEERRSPEELQGAVQDFLLPDDEVMARGNTSVSSEGRGSSVLMFVPRVLLFTSRLSFVSQHREILTQLYQHFFSPVTTSLPSLTLPCSHSSSAASPASSFTFPCVLSCSCIEPVRLDCTGREFESYLTLLTQEVPLPQSGGPPVELSIACRTYRLSLPAIELDFPHLEFDLFELFQVLDVESVLMVMRCVLSEMKLIFYSQSRTLLHSVSESIIALCFPFTWSHVYVPLLPKSLLGIMEAPVSFILGMHSSTPPDLEHITDLSAFALVDIDRSTVDVAQPPPAFPAHAVRVLLKGLRRLIRPNVFKADELRAGGEAAGEAELYQRLHPECGGGACSRVNAELVAVAAAPGQSSLSVPPALRAQEERELAGYLSREQRCRLIRHEVFAFLSSLLHGYREFLWFMHGLTPTFHTSAFLSSSSSSDHVPFLSRFLETQLFRDFLDRHVEMPSYLQDLAVYCNAGTSSSHGMAPSQVVPPRPVRSWKEWTHLVHPHTQTPAAVAEPANTDEAEPEPRHWSSLTPPIAEHVAVDVQLPPSGAVDCVPVFVSVAHRKSSSGEDLARSQTFFSSSALLSPVVIHRERLRSANAHTRDFSFTESTVSLPRHRSRVSTVLSLAPAVTTFTSSQTLSIVTAAAQKAGSGSTAPDGGSDAESPVQAEDASSDSVLCYRSWLLAPPRALPPVERVSASGAESPVFSSAKNPSTLLHPPLPAMTVNAAGEFEAVGGIRPGESGTKSKPNAASPDSSPNPLLIQGQLPAEDQLTVAIDTHRTLDSSRRLSPTPSPGSSRGPSPAPNGSAGGEQLSVSSTSFSPRHQHSRHDSFGSSLPQPSPRPQSSSLVSKSELELRKPHAQRRLPQLLSAIFSKGSTQVIDVGELSAVGELLALSEWRSMMVDLIGRSYGGYEGRGVDGKDRDRGMEVEAFSALLLLFNVALEECAAEHDYVTAYALLQFAEKIYTSHQQAASANSAQLAFPPAPPTPHHTDRIYLLPSLKKQPLWQHLPLWAFVYAAEVHRRRHSVWPNQSCALCTSKEAAAAVDPALAELCLDVLCELIGTCVSLGCPESMLRAFVHDAASQDDGLLQSQRPMLLQLVQSTVKATDSMRGATSRGNSPKASVRPLPAPIVVMRGSSAGSEGAGKGELSGAGRLGTGGMDVSPIHHKYVQGKLKEFTLDADR